VGRVRVLDEVVPNGIDAIRIVARKATLSRLRSGDVVTGDTLHVGRDLLKAIRGKREIRETLTHDLENLRCLPASQLLGGGGLKLNGDLLTGLGAPQLIGLFRCDEVRGLHPLEHLHTALGKLARGEVVRSRTKLGNLREHLLAGLRLILIAFVRLSGLLSLGLEQLFTRGTQRSRKWR